jgi:hypothetical protein
MDGIVAIGSLPLLGIYPKNLENLRLMAKVVAKKQRKKIRILKFTNVEVLEEF